MTEIVPDTVEVDCYIGGLPWHVIEAKVELSQVATPNYVDMVITPDPDQTVPELPPAGDISQLVGDSFYLAANNQLISERRTDAEEDSVLFIGNIANISPTGENTFEAIAYDPSQQAFNIGKDSGSVINMSLNVAGPSVSVVNPNNVDDLNADENAPYTQRASEVIRAIVEFANIQNYEIRLSPDGITVPTAGPLATRQIGVDENIEFQGKYVNVKGALNRIREVTESEWWFDKRGKFYFGALSKDDISVHRLKFIKDTTAGITTPPYQSVEVIGKGAASQEGWSYNSAITEPRDMVVKRARIAQPTGNILQPTGEDEPSTGSSNIFSGFGSDKSKETARKELGKMAQKVIIMDELSEPVFRYVNAEISTQKQAAGVARSILDQLIKQQAKGEITVVGFPEVTPFDGIQMPGTRTTEGSVFNDPSTNEPPMGGRRYGVYKVTHHLNASDGFITKITVSGPVNVTQFAFIEASDLISDVNVDRRVYDESQLGIYDEQAGLRVDTKKSDRSGG